VPEHRSAARSGFQFAADIDRDRATTRSSSTVAWFTFSAALYFRAKAPVPVDDPEANRQRYRQPEQELQGISQGHSRNA
jgi:hypothetical protein